MDWREVREEALKLLQAKKRKLSINLNSQTQLQSFLNGGNIFAVPEKTSQNPQFLNSWQQPFNLMYNNNPCHLTPCLILEITNENLQLQLHMIQSIHECSPTKRQVQIHSLGLDTPRCLKVPPPPPTRVVQQNPSSTHKKHVITNHKCKSM
jgi:hypothetical protein